jgi:hypothetical protein
MMRMYKRAQVKVRQDEAEDGAPVPGTREYVLVLDQPLNPSPERSALDLLDGIDVSVRITTDEVY